MKDKRGFMLYVDLIHTLNKMEDAQAGKLFKHILEYVNDNNPTADMVTELVFEPIKQQLKRDLDKYIKKCAKNSENVKKRWNNKSKDDTTVYDGIQTNTNVYEHIPSDTKHTDTDTDTDTDKDKERLNKDSTSNRILAADLRHPSAIHKQRDRVAEFNEMFTE